MEMVIQLTNGAKQALMEGTPWAGKCTVRFKDSELDLEVKKAAKSSKHRALIPSKEEQQVIDYWNSHPYMITAERKKEVKNRKVIPSNLRLSILTIRKALKKIGIYEIKNG